VLWSVNVKNEFFQKCYRRAGTQLKQQNFAVLSAYVHIYTVSKNPCHYVFDDDLKNRRPIVIVFGTVITYVTNLVSVLPASPHCKPNHPVHPHFKPKSGLVDSVGGYIRSDATLAAQQSRPESCRLQDLGRHAAAGVWITNRERRWAEATSPRRLAWCAAAHHWLGWNYLSITYSLSNNCTKHYYNRTLTAQVIIEDVVTWIFCNTVHCFITAVPSRFWSLIVLKQQSVQKRQSGFNTGFMMVKMMSTFVSLVVTLVTHTRTATLTPRDEHLATRGSRRCNFMWWVLITAARITGSIYHWSTLKQ